jgi:hypothetical protein
MNSDKNKANVCTLCAVLMKWGYSVLGLVPAQCTEQGPMFAADSHYHVFHQMLQWEKNL